MKRSPLTRKTLLKRSAPRFPKRGISPASREQKAKVKREGPRIGFPVEDEPVDAAHVIPRSLGGCDHEDCVIGLTRRQHREYDEGKCDILPYLTLEEQAHAVAHVGILKALQRVTNAEWVELGSL